jgi:hypothetical protein
MRHLDGFGDFCRQPEGPQAVWGGKNRKAVGLKPPEIVILVSRKKFFVQSRATTLVEGCGVALLECRFGQMTERDAAESDIMGLSVVVRLIDTPASARVSISARISGWVELST